MLQTNVTISFLVRVKQFTQKKTTSHWIDSELELKLWTPLWHLYMHQTQYLKCKQVMKAKPLTIPLFPQTCNRKEKHIQIVNNNPQEGKVLDSLLAK